MNKILLKNGKIFDGEKFFNADLLIEDGKIVNIGKDLQPSELNIDVTGNIISSGLIDIHTHLSEMGSLAFGFPSDMATIPFGVTRAVDACAEYSNPDVLDYINVDIKAFIPLQIKGDGIDLNEMEKRLAHYKDRSLGVKVFFDKEQFDYITKTHLRLACEFAQEKGLKVMVHSTGSETPMIEIVELLNEGDILTHAYHGGNNSIVKDDYSAYKLAKEKRVIIDVGMAGGVHTDFKILRSGIENGYVPDTISSDITKFSAYIRGGVYGLTSCMSILKVLGLKEEEIFKAVTINPAKLVLNSDSAKIRVGANATLSVLSWEENKIDLTDRWGNNLKTDKSYVNKMTIKNGQIIYRR